MQELFTELDHDKDGKISFKEWIGEGLDHQGDGPAAGDAEHEDAKNAEEDAYGAEVPSRAGCFRCVASLFIFVWRSP